MTGIALTGWEATAYLRYLAGDITRVELLAAINQVRRRRATSVNACHPQAIVVIVETDRPD